MQLPQQRTTFPFERWHSPRMQAKHKCQGIAGRKGPIILVFGVDEGTVSA